MSKKTRCTLTSQMIKRIPTALKHYKYREQKNENIPSSGTNPQSKVTNLNWSNNVIVKSVSRAKSKTLRSYFIPTVEIQPEVIVNLYDTNKLRRFGFTPKIIACEIVDLMISVQTDKVISGITQVKIATTIKPGILTIVYRSFLAVETSPLWIIVTQIL